jgi:hypothetical protein
MQLPEQAFSMQTVTGLFESHALADAALAALAEAGYEQQVIGVLARDEVLREVGAARESVGGAVLGGLAGLVAGISAVALPGVGMVVSVGTLATVLGTTALGAGAGAAAGGIIGSLLDLGIPDQEAELLAEGVKRSGVLVLVTVAEDRVSEVDQMLKQAGALDTTTLGRQWRAAGWEGFDPTMDPGEQYPRL